MSRRRPAAWLAIALLLAGAIAPATVGAASPPECPDDNVTINEDDTASGALACTDADGDTLTYALESGASDGNANVQSDGSYTYTPDRRLQRLGLVHLLGQRRDRLVRSGDDLDHDRVGQRRTVIQQGSRPDGRRELLDEDRGELGNRDQRRVLPTNPARPSTSSSRITTRACSRPSRTSARAGR